jgi:hypothetical protein
LTGLHHFAPAQTKKSKKSENLKGRSSKDRPSALAKGLIGFLKDTG